jgi:hypothetical protein
MLSTISQEHLKLFAKWCDAADVQPKNEATVIAMLEYLYGISAPVNFENLNAAAASSDLQGRLHWVPTPTPANYAEIVQAWIAKQNRGLLAEHGRGLSPDMASRVAGEIENQFGNHYSESNLDQALEIVRTVMFGAPKVLKTQDQLEREHEAKLLAQDVKRRVEEKKANTISGAQDQSKHELTRGEAQQSVAKMLGRLIQGGHKKFAHDQDVLLRGMLNEGKSVQECWTTLEANTANYLATIEIKKIIETAPGRNVGERNTNSAYLAKSADGLQREGMPLRDVAYHLLEESEAIRLKQNQV